MILADSRFGDDLPNGLPSSRTLVDVMISASVRVFGLLMRWLFFMATFEISVFVFQDTEIAKHLGADKVAHRKEV